MPIIARKTEESTYMTRSLVLIHLIRNSTSSFPESGLRGSGT